MPRHDGPSYDRRQKDREAKQKLWAEQQKAKQLEKQLAEEQEAKLKLRAEQQKAKQLEKQLEDRHTQKQLQAGLVDLQGRLVDNQKTACQLEQKIKQQDILASRNLERHVERARTVLTREKGLREAAETKAAALEEKFLCQADSSSSSSLDSGSSSSSSSPSARPSKAGS